ncbi:glycosyltransferase 87 family protein [Spirosoma montaniterrae]|uniref:Mannosyltransferase n=1 Tax=Spirosoma montaniterrae TaxID=1178516 RepID=A0A1P9X074_9BACT|nr:glycosyltransferase 87 family protein [Spirosoma montaniterrae]AQG80998.1 hypothetical protein AWR27_17730 [Spirosoma montaniterrae]
MNQPPQLPFRLGWLGLSAGLYGLLGYGVQREQFPLLITLYALLFWGYLLRVRPLSLPSTDAESQLSDRLLFGAAIAFRLLLLPAMPHFSDDFVRFIWDGRLLANGFNPYLYLPRQLLQTPIAASAGLTDELFYQLNSPDYYTVYPPLNQFFFAIAAWLSPVSIQGSVIGLRVPILLADIGSIWLMMKLLRQSGRNPNLALLYALNPLVILELTGNLHFEGVVIFFVLLAAWLFVTVRLNWSAVAFGLAVSTKLLPLILLPMLLRYMITRRAVLYCCLVGLVTTGLFLPFVSIDLFRNIGTSLNLYVQKFEFNASIYYLVREVGYWVKGYNIIGTAGLALSLLTLVGILYMASGRFQQLSGNRVLLTLTLYFALATTVHPWYITSLVAAAVFTRFRYPLIWSGAVWLSYATYQTVPYQENLWLTALSYGLVVLAFFRERFVTRVEARS